MMTYFLTSSPCCDDGSMNPKNGFAELFAASLKTPCKALFIASAPDDVVLTEQHAYDMKANYEKSGITFSEYSCFSNKITTSSLHQLLKSKKALTC